MILLGRISEKLVLVIDFVLLNASALLVAADIAKDYVEDTKFARESLMSTTLMASIACMDTRHQGKAHWDLTRSVKKQFNCWNGRVVRTEKQ